MNMRRVEQMRRAEGFRQPEDIYDNTSFDEIAKEVERESIWHIRDFVEHKEGIYKHALEVAQMLAEDYQKKFLQEAERYYTETGRLRPEMLEFLKEKKMDRLRIDVRDGVGAKDWLADRGLDQWKLTFGHILLVIKLPKQLELFWRKNGEQPRSKQSVDIKGTSVEWGKIYEDTLPAIWRMYGREIWTQWDDITVQRVNALGQHDPDEYYYVWDLGKKNTHRGNAADEDEDGNF